MQMKNWLTVLFLGTVLLVWGQTKEPVTVLGTGDTLDLSIAPISLNEVVLSNKKIGVDELISKARVAMKKHYLSQQPQEIQYFIRRSDYTQQNTNFTLKKSTDPSFNPTFFKNLAQSIPTRSDVHKEGIFRAAIGNGNTGLQTEMVKGMILEDEDKTFDIANIEEQLEKKITKGLEAGHFFKVKSGVFGKKLKEDDFEFSSKKAKDSAKTPEQLTQERIKRSAGQAMQAQGWRKEMEEAAFFSEDGQVDVFENYKKYRFQIIDYRWYQNDWVYVVRFEPKSGASFNGTLWINETDYAVVQYKFNNLKPIKSFALLGIAYKVTGYKGHYIYKPNTQGGYQLHVGMLRKEAWVRVDRPLSMMERKSRTIGSKKLNEVDFKVNFKATKQEEFTYLLQTQKPLKSEEISTWKPNHQIEWTKLNSYDKSFWGPALQLPPNESMEAFKLSKVN